ncbi:hypothetical protein [Psychromonas aquatilis]|uniref:PAP2 superfamily protein n=1 Tax=Psychromonas aquatilis TaxID=2005072 RepID=A0ABU9GT05_9GAMM
MLAYIADLYTPILALFCLYYLRFKFNNRLAFLCFIAYCYVYGFAFIELYFGWWASMASDFSSHTASVMVIVCALLGCSYKVGAYALVSLFFYGALMNYLDYHSWFDILTTMLVCLPCLFIFKVFFNQQAK